MTKRKRKSITYLLRGNAPKDIIAAKARTQDLLNYYWDEHAALSRQRHLIRDEIGEALITACTSDYTFNHWQRSVKYRYSLHPLCTIGSTRFAGGRFNYGEDINAELSSFPALYIAIDKDTALQEHLGQNENNTTPGLSPREAALTNPISETTVSISGKLDKIFDLTCSDNLSAFIKLIKKFKLPYQLIKQAEKLNINKSKIISTKAKLHADLLNPNWREKPVRYDIPANSQIFGHLVYIAGIEGILYPSKLTRKNCLAIFTHNFNQSDSWIQLDDEAPDKLVPKKIDEANWRLCDLNHDDII